MFRFIIVSFCFISGIAYIFQKNAGYETGFSTSNNYVSASYNGEGYGDIDPQYQEKYENTAGLTEEDQAGLETSPQLNVSVALLPVKKPPVLLALPVLRPDPNSLVKTAEKTVNGRITLTSARGTVPEKYQPKIFNIPDLKPEHMTVGKLLKQRQLEIAGNTAVVYRNDLAETSEQYSRHSQVKLKKLFKSNLKRHPYGYRLRSVNSFSYYVPKKDPSYYFSKSPFGYTTPKVKKGKKGSRRRTASKSSSKRRRR